MSDTLTGAYVPPDAPTAALHGKLAEARAAGFSWDEINASMAQRRQAALDAGFTPDQIDAHMGQTDGLPVTTRARTLMSQIASPRIPEGTRPETTGILDTFWNALTESSTGFLLRGELPDRIMPQDAGMATRIAHMAGVAIGDLPMMVAGGMAGRAVGAVGGPVGMALGAGAGSMMLPGAIRAEYIDALVNGDIKSAEDFVVRKAGVAWSALKEGIVGAAAAGAGKLAGAATDAAAARFAAAGTAPAGVEATARMTSELVAMTTAASALEGHLPSPQDFVDGAVLLGAFGLAGRGAAKLMPGQPEVPGIREAVRTQSPIVVQNLARHWAETGEPPIAAARRAMQDPVFRQELVAPRPPEPVEAVSTPTPAGDMVIPTLEPPLAAGARLPIRASAEWYVAWVNGGFGPNGVNFDRTMVAFGEDAANPRVRMPTDTAEGMIPVHLQEFARRAGFRFISTPEMPREARTVSENSPHMQAAGRGGRYDTVEVNIPRNPSEVWQRWWGLGRFEVIYHEVGHALDVLILNKMKGVTRDLWLPKEMNDPANLNAFQSEVVAASKKFRPEMWKVQEQYNMKPEELMADAIAYWLMHPENHQDMPLFTTAFGEQLAPYRELAGRTLPVPAGMEKWYLPGSNDPVQGGPKLGGQGTSPAQPPGPGGAPPPPPPGSAAAPGQGGGGGTPPGGGAPPGAGSSGGPVGPVNHWRQLNERFGREQQPGWWDRIKEIARRVWLEVGPPDDPLVRLQRTVEKQQGMPLSEIANPQWWRRLADVADVSSTRVTIENRMLDINGRPTGLEGLLKIVEPFRREGSPIDNPDRPNFWAYALARVDLAEQSNNARLTGVPFEATRAVMLDPAAHAKYGQAFDKMLAWRNETLKWELDAGLINRERYDAMIALGDAGLSLRRIEDPLAPEHARPPSPTGGTREGHSTAKRRVGSDAPIEEFLKTLMEDAFARRRHALNAIANRTAFDAAEPYGLATKLDGSSPPIPGQVSKHLGWTLRADDVIVWRDGAPEHVRFADPYIAPYMKSMDQMHLNTWQRIMSALTRPMRTAVVVLDPSFSLRQNIYDMFSHQAEHPDVANTLANLYHGVGALLSKGTKDPVLGTSVWDRAVENGGLTGVFQHMTKDQYIQDVLKNRGDPAFTSRVWNSIANPYQALQAWAKVSNQLLRVGQYSILEQQGASPRRAGVMAGDLAMPREGGSGPAAMNINALQPFFTGYLQGLERTVRAQFGLGTTAAGTPFNPVKTTAWMTALVTTPAILTWMNNKDEDWYKALPSWEKDNGLHFNVGSAKNPTILFIPFPPLVGLLYGGIPKRMLEHAVQGNEDAFKNMKSGIMGALLPPVGALATSFATPMIEHLANYSFFRGRPLVDQHTKDTLSTPLQYTQYTTETAKQLSKTFEQVIPGHTMSPPVIENYIRGWSGSFGLGVVRQAESLLRMAGVLPDNKPAETLADLPILSSWLKRYPTATAAPIMDFREAVKDIKTVHGDMMLHLREDNPQAFADLAEKNPGAVAMQKFRGAKMVFPTNDEPYQRALEGVQDRIAPIIDDLRKVHETEKALDTLGRLAQAIGRFPNAKDLTPQQVEGIRMLAETTGATPPADGRITAVEKQQLLDSVYTMMQHMAEDGLGAIKRAGLRRK